MPQPDFLPSGAPVPKPQLPFASPNVPAYKPTGLPPGMSPLPKTEIAPINNPVGKPGTLDKPSPKPYPPPGRGVRGDNFGKKPIGKPLNPPVPRTPSTGPPQPTVPQLIKRVIEYVLEPQPTSDGTQPDFEEREDPTGPEPEEGDQNSLEQTDCLSPIQFPELRGTGDSYVQLEYAENTAKFSYIGPEPGDINRSLGIKKFLRSKMADDRAPLSRGTDRYKVVGKKTIILSNGSKDYIYKYAIWRDGYRFGDNKFWRGRIGYGWGNGRGIRGELGPANPLLDPINYLPGRSWPTILGSRFVIRVGACSEDPKEPQDPNDYDREEDDEGMACKWKPSNDSGVEGLQIESYEFKTFENCSGGDSGTEPSYRTDSVDLPICVGGAMKNMLDKIAKLEGAQCSGNSRFWNIKEGDPSTVYAGIPAIQGSEISLPRGCVNVGITFDNAEAKQDGSLRNLKRIGNVNASGETFINTMRVWLIDGNGNAIDDKELWVPSTLLAIPFRYRNEICKIRMMPKGLAVTFTVFDTGDRWEPKTLS